MKYILVLVLLAGCVATRETKSDIPVRVNGSSGFYYDGYIVTCAHVVRNEDNIIIEDQNGRASAGILYKYDSLEDVAVVIPLFRWNIKPEVNTKPRVGMKIHAIGNPGGMKFAYSNGYISGINYDYDGQKIMYGCIDIYFGSSGSPVFSKDGKIIGMVSAIIEGSRFVMIVPIAEINKVIQAPD